MAKRTGTKVITGKVRFSYANVFEAKSINGSDPKYSVSVLIPKTDKETLKAIEEAVDQAIEDGKSKLTNKSGTLVKKALKLPLRDGDDERPDDEAYQGHYFLNATSYRKPGVVDEKRQDLYDYEDFYSGCYGRVSLNFYAFEASGNKGIACGLQNLQKLEDGESLTGRVSASDDFADFDDDADAGLLG